MDMDEALDIADDGIHDDPEEIDRALLTLASEVRRLRAENEHLRATQTTGGPPPAFTPGWTPGASSRPPTAPPEPEVVELAVAVPLTKEEVAALPEYRTCGSCGWPHPAWTSCEVEEALRGSKQVVDPLTRDVARGGTEYPGERP